jgi:hypothetical protein
VRQLNSANTAQISFEERDEDIFVFVTDKSGDGHRHKLAYRSGSKEQALELLRQKQMELNSRP